MTENFADLFESSPNQIFAPGKIIKGTIVRFEKDNVIVDAGLKSEGVIPRTQFLNERGELDVVVGDEVDVAVEKMEDGFGETVLSRERARRLETWIRLVHAHEKNETIQGYVSGKVKGGFTVELNDLKAFLPGSLIDVRPLRDTSHLEHKTLDFKVIKIDQKRNNIVVSRRAVLEEMGSGEREALLGQLEEGQELKGVVKNLTDYGAFIDLGGLDGLLHITDMSWKRIKHPNEVLHIGDEIEVKVLKYDREKNRVSLGMKQLGDDPWSDLASRYRVGDRVNGKITTITDYGAFVEINNGVEGLIHMSEMDWTNKNANPNKIVTVGQEVEVMVLEIDQERRRFSLGLKQCIANPWDAFANKHSVGEKMTATIKSITDFGVFIGLDGSVDGLIHLSDLSWEKPAEDAVRDYKKGDSVEAVILAIDPERERISLGIKQLTPNVFGEFVEKYPKNSIISGTVKSVDEHEAIIELTAEVEGRVKAMDISDEKIDDARNALKVGDTVEAKVMGVDRKSRMLNLSIKAKDHFDQKAALKELKQSAAPNAKLGDLFKDSM
jgi:small subunit ribosomal protein S1